MLVELLVLLMQLVVLVCLKALEVWLELVVGQYLALSAFAVEHRPWAGQVHLSLAVEQLAVEQLVFAEE